MAPSANPLRCSQCKEAPPLMKEGFWPWKRVLRPIVFLSAALTLSSVIFLCVNFIARLAPVPLLFAIVFAICLYANSKPDFYECPKCGHKKGAFWV